MISIIIPVYNVEQYLDKCLQSVINQTYQDIEIILVDDGSSDSSGILCDKWKEKDSRIKVIHKSNGGLSNARNVGIEQANGKYLMFIDSDDIVANDLCKVLFEMLKNNHADISICNATHIFNNEFDFKNTGKIYCYDCNEAISQLWYQKSFLPSAWGKLYKKSLFNNIRFPKGKIYEDMFTTYKLIFRSRCIVKSERKLYHYLIREDSILGTVNVKKQLDMVEAAEEMLDFAIKNASSSIKAATYRVSISSIMVIAHCQVINRNKYEEQIKTNLWNNIKGNRIKIIFDPNAKNKYKILAMISLCGKKALQLFYQKFAKR